MTATFEQTDILGSTDSNNILNDAVIRSNLTMPANEIFTQHPVLFEMTKRYVYHISPFIENPLDGRPLIDIAIENAITSYYATDKTDDGIAAQHAYIDALLTRASMLLDYEIKFFKINWEPFGENGLTHFLNQYPLAQISYGNKIRPANLDDYRHFILIIIATTQEIKQIGLCFKAASQSPEYGRKDDTA